VRIHMVRFNRRGSIMPTILDFLYREYCRARLAEMWQQLLISNESQAVPEVHADGYPGGSADREGCFGGDRTAIQNEARLIH
jgi:hypothetical protein